MSKDKPLFGTRVRWVAENQLKVLDPKLLNAVFRPALSYSAAETIQQCPAKLVGSRGTPKKVNIFASNEIGGVTHLVYEDLMALPKPERTKERARQLFEQIISNPPRAWNDTDIKTELALLPPTEQAQWIERTMRVIEGLWGIEDPTTVDVVSCEQRFTNVPFGVGSTTAIIDRVDKGPDGTVRLVDYKSGADKSEPNPRYTDSHRIQVTIYAMVFEQETGQKVSEVSLYYVEHNKKRTLVVTDEMREAALSFFNKGWELNNTCGETETYPTIPGPLCGWCPLVNACPVPNRVTSEKDPRENTPGWEELGFTQPPQESVQFNGGLGGVGGEPTVVDQPLPTATPTFPPPMVGGAAHEEGVSETNMVLSNVEETMSNENKPWETLDNNGQLNMNSYAAIGVTGTTALAVELIDANKARLHPAVMAQLTAVLGAVVLEAQRTLSGGTADWSAGLNSRIRGAVAAFGRSTSGALPLGRPEEVWREWQQRAVRFAVAYVQTSQSLFYGQLVDTDLSALVGDKPF